MPYDSELSRLQSELLNIEEEIIAINSCLGFIEYSLDLGDTEDMVKRTLHRTLNRLIELKLDKERKIRMHNQRVELRGIKY